jgi:hypothetical protein
MASGDDGGLGAALERVCFYGRVGIEEVMRVNFVPVITNMRMKHSMWRVGNGVTNLNKYIQSIQP